MNDKAEDAKYSKFLARLGGDFITLTEDVKLLKFLWKRFVAHQINEEYFFAWVRVNKDKTDFLKYFSLVSTYHEVIVIPKTTMYDVFVSLERLGSSFAPAKRFMSRIDQTFHKFMADIEQRVLTLQIGEEVFKKYLKKVFRNYAIDEERFLAWIKVNKDKSDYIKYFYSLLVLYGFITTADRRQIAVRDMLLSISSTYSPAEVLLEHLNMEFVEFLREIEKDFVQLQADSRFLKEFFRERFIKWAIYDEHFFSWVFANIDMSHFTKYLCAVVIIYEVMQDPTKVMRYPITKLEALEKLKEIEANYPPALYIIGNIYHGTILGRMQNYTKALDCFEKASEKGVLRANYELIRYYFGLFNVPSNIERARFYYDKSVKLGGNEADYILGFCMVTQRQPPSDEEFENGLGYIKRAAENGCKYALDFFRTEKDKTWNFGAKVQKFLDHPDNSRLKTEVSYREAWTRLFCNYGDRHQVQHDFIAVTILQELRGHRKSQILLSWCLQNKIGLKGYKSESTENKKDIFYSLEAHRLLLEISTNSNGANLALASSNVPQVPVTTIIAANNVLMRTGIKTPLTETPDLARTM